MSQWIQQRDHDVTEAERQGSYFKDAYSQGMRSLGEQFGAQTQQMLASLGSRGFGRSGVVSHSYGQLAKDRSEGEAKLALDSGPLRWQQMADDAQTARQAFSTNKLNETSLAKERYTVEHGKAPKRDHQGYWKRGSTWFYTNKDGVTVSVGARRPKKHGGK
jgi:hypothetical protein